MDIGVILIESLWTALFATGLGIVLTTPVQGIVPCFLCGFAGRFVRDVCMGCGMSQNWATVVAAAVVVLVGVAIIRRNHFAPAVLFSGVLPLGATVAMFNMIIELMKLSSLKGDASIASSVAFSANMGKVFTTSLSIAIGLWIGIAVVQFCSRKESQDGERQAN